MTNGSTVKGPWYRYFREEVGRATGFVAAINDSSQSIPRETYATFEKETLAAFIFESNNLEREGLPLGETRELVFAGLKEFPQVEAQTLRYLDFIDLFGSDLFDSLFALDELIDEQNAIVRNNLPKNKDLNEATLHVVYKSKSKEARTVSQYLEAAMTAELQVMTRKVEDLYVSIYWADKSDQTLGTKSNKNSHRDLNLVNIKSLLNEEFIKNLHKTMAEGLIKSQFAPAGEYRKHPVSTDMESHYPAPSDVPRAMEKFIEQFQAMEQEHINPIVLAAWASTQFVLIHPFSDFNGRMSRLIANMILRTNGVPFWTALRSTKKERARYITALRHYRRDSRRSIATLIAKQMNYNFEEFNKILSLSGYEPIVPSPEFTALSAEALETTKFLPYSVWAKHEYEAAVTKSQQ